MKLKQHQQPINQKAIDRWLMADTDEKHQYGCTAWQLSPNHPRPIEKFLMSILQCLSFFLVAEFEMTVLQIPFLFWWRSLAAFLVSSLASLSSQCGTSSSASRSLFTRSVPSRKVFYKNYHPGIFCIQIWEIIPYLYREEVRHRRLSSLPSILSTNWYTLLKSASLSSKSEY